VERGLENGVGAEKRMKRPRITHDRIATDGWDSFFAAF
jgi:hypothetical protein